MGRSNPHSVMLGIMLVALGGYAIILRRHRALGHSGDAFGMEAFDSMVWEEHADQIRQAHRVNQALKESEELLGDSALLSLEVQQLSEALSRAVEYEITHAQAGLPAPASGTSAMPMQALDPNGDGPGHHEPIEVYNAQKQAQAWEQRRQQMARRAGAAPDIIHPAMPTAVHKWLTECTDTTQRAQHVKNAMTHAWDSYVKYAWGMDELQPLSKKGKSSFGGLGATIIDSLDTLKIMGLNSRFQQARDFVLNLNFDKSFDASVFETTIRVVGGLLSAHDLSGGEEIFLKKTEELVKRLLPAFNTPTGIPFNLLNLHTRAAKNPAWTGKMSTLAEFGTEQMEFFMLSAKTQNNLYREKAERPIKLIHQKYPKKGLIPLYLNPQSGDLSTKAVSFGALGDSYYEYLLKVWILFGKNDEMFRSMWELAMDEMLETLIHKTKPSGYTYVAELSRSGALVHKMDHLACFVPGMLALGVHHKAVSGPKADRYMQVAKELTDTCFHMYQRNPGGLAAEYVEARSGQDFVISPRAAFNLQRPEAVEAFFVLWRVTGDEKYREYGWSVFSAFETYTKVDSGYCGIKDVTRMPMARDDTMQSFWLAETLKYLYLLFSPNDKISLDEWVLNTEAHPMMIKPWKYNSPSSKDVKPSQ